MKPENCFLRQPKSFWAHVRSISEEIGYTERGEGRIRVPRLEELASSLVNLGLNVDHVVVPDGSATEFGQLLLDYFVFRAKVLDTFVEPRLMDAEKAKRVYDELAAVHKPAIIPMNKQKGDKKAPAFLTGIIAMLVTAAGAEPFDRDPRSLTTITRDGRPLRTFARRVDGAFPSVVNPIAVWEIKEYYYTTTFGSRVADGVYESLLDGLELEELREHEGIDVKHYLMVDSHYTWWKCGRSYLCRIIDMLHMGYVDEVLFGYEVIERLPSIVDEWKAIEKNRKANRTPIDGSIPAGSGIGEPT